MAWRAIILALAVLCSAWSAAAQSRADVESQFSNWLRDDLWPAARRAGVSQQTFNAAFSGVRLDWDLPDLVPPGSAPPATRRQSQAEFRSPAAYFSESSLQNLAASGRALASQHREAIAAIERRYGVPGHFLIAIWGRESGFGRADIPHSAIDVLATKAFMSTRPELFQGELLAALQILERGDITPERMKSSWAGAMGQPQFLPSSYLKYAVDFDGDGRRDIWQSVPDTLASIANYLAQSGWQRGRDWGFEVTIPGNVSCAQEGPDRARPIAEWVGLGITRVSGSAFPEHELRGAGMMLVPAGRHGPEFIVTPNFYVFKQYNNSDNYALFIGNLGDRIAYGSGAFRKGWGDVGSMLRSDIASMQQRLVASGYDVGGADGLPGYKTRRSIGEWQARNGHAPTCFPDRALLGALQ
ncbi:lytic murein transglycosylase [Pararhizobium haloflavum]|uniref:lytic murein transglycosylase n=1 Tax=Pararhizobium haloflavum TaxID=2037914 RepID=UPI000C18CD3F|nr:lytic murein transglycosylase [Pararhizobium haloflavum]